MEQQFTVNGEKLVVKMPRELDHHYATGLCSQIDLMIDAYNIRKLVFDFMDTEFMDSSGIGVIIGRTRNIGFLGGTTYAIHLNGQIRKIFHDTAADTRGCLGITDRDAIVFGVALQSG